MVLKRDGKAVEKWSKETPFKRAFTKIQESFFKNQVLLLVSL